MIGTLVPAPCAHALAVYHCCLKTGVEPLTAEHYASIKHLADCFLCHEEIEALEEKQFVSRGACLLAVRLIPYVQARRPYVYVSEHPVIVSLFNYHAKARLPGCDCYARMCQARNVIFTIRDPFGEALIQLYECLLEENSRRNHPNSHDE